MKRTLVERVAKLAHLISYCGVCGHNDSMTQSNIYARRIIAMVRRNDRKEKGR